MMDVMATGGVAAVLSGIGLWSYMVINMVQGIPRLSGGLDAVELPLLTKFFWQAAESHVLPALSAALLLIGFWVLFTTRDRLRGIVYGIVVALMYAVVTILAQFSLSLPFIRIIQEVSP